MVGPGSPGRIASGGWVGLCANANSGMGRGRVRVAKCVAALARRGIEARVAWAVDDRRALVAASAADPDCRCVVAVGGDGTVNSLINEGPSVPIAVLPAGTENLFAAQFGLSRSPDRLADVIAQGRLERIDLGTAGDRRFALMAGFGFDADVVGRHHLGRLGRAGSVRVTHRAAYVGPVLRSSVFYRFPPLLAEFDDPETGRAEALVGTSIFAFNFPRYALGLPFAPSARADDGLLDLVVFRDPGPFRALGYLSLVALGRHLRSRSVAHRRVRRVALSATSAGPVPAQIDGDPAGLVSLGEPDHPRALGVIPAALDVVVPATYHADAPTGRRRTLRATAR